MTTTANCICSECGHTWKCTPDNYDCPYCGDWRKPLIKRVVEEATSMGITLDEFRQLVDEYYNEEIP